MMKLLKLLLILLISSNSMSQKFSDIAFPVNECMGAVNIFENGKYQIQFTGNKSTNLLAYPSLRETISSNTVWCSYIAETSGVLSFSANKSTGFTQMVIFIERENDICGEIESGSAEIQRVSFGKDIKQVGLNSQIEKGIMYPMKFTKGMKVHVLFATNDGLKDNLSLDWNFKEDVVPIVESKLIDRRSDDFSPALMIKVRDKDTKLPVIANLTLEGFREIDALYVGSDFIFNLVRNCQGLIKCDAQGYFFVDRDETILASESKEIIIELEKIAKGKSMQIEEIEFVPGTSEITKSSYPKLRRLKDFLLLNADLNIEIQGHVFALGENSFAGQKISEARAKRVMHYLIDNGVAKERLIAVGYGNTKPIYKEPKFSYEEQANRRVEIVIR